MAKPMKADNKHKLLSRIDRKYLVLTLIGVLLPFAIIATLVFHYGVNVPFGDDWSMVSIFQHIDQGNLSFGDLWVQHNEHRIFFPRLAIIGVAYLTHWHQGALMICNLIISLISVAVLVAFVWRTIQNKALAAATSTLVSFWFYSTVQWENWLWGWQIEWFMCIASVLMTLLLVDLFVSRKEDAYRFGLIGIPAIIATFSLGSGALVLPIALLWLVVRKVKRNYVVGGAAFSLLLIFIYYFHYTKPPDSTPTSYLFHHPIKVVAYFFVYIGRPLSDEVHVAGAAGLAAVVLMITAGIFLWRRRMYTAKFLPWIALLVFSLMADAITTISRVGFGLEQAVSSRYTATSLLFYVGLTGLIATVISLSKHPKKAYVAFAVVSAVLIIVSDVQGLSGFKSRSANMQVIKSCTHQANPTKECLLVVIPGAGVSINDLNYIKDKHWAGY
ncbi:MAG TPA: hypothetical protein VHC21_00945 [Candidatus Saccharimonadales bacterium]|nr:hypothetical protein [Candidatus Saccharimonadales bacterium]